MLLQGYLDDCIVLISKNRFKLYRMIDRLLKILYAFENYMQKMSGNVMMSSTLTRWFGCEKWEIYFADVMRMMIMTADNAHCSETSTLIQIDFIHSEFYLIFRSATKCQSKLLLCVGRGTCIVNNVQGDTQKRTDIHSTCQASALEGWKFFFFFFHSNSFYFPFFALAIRLLRCVLWY